MNQLSLDLITNAERPKLIKAQGGTLFYSSLLMCRHDVPEGTLKVRRSEYKKGKSQNYNHHRSVNENGKIIHWYDTTSLPTIIFEKYNLPSIRDSSKFFSPELQRHIISQEPEKDQKDKPETTLIKSLTVELTIALDRAYKSEHLFLKNMQFANEACFLSQKYEVLLSIINYMKDPQPRIIKSIHFVLLKPPFEHLNFTKKLKSFYNYLQRASEAEDLKVFVLGKWNVKDNARKINGVIEELICHFAGHPNGAVPLDKIRIWVNVMILAFPKLNGKRTLTIRSVENCVKLNRNKIDCYRNGEEHIRKVVAGYLHMASAMYPMDQFFMDEWYIDMVCKKSKKSIRKIVIAMMDGRSQKTIHHELVLTLNREVVKKFFHYVVKLCQYRISAELVCDFASYNVCDYISRMFNYLVYKYKSRFAWTVSSNANRKVEIERFWKTIGSYYLSPQVGAIGQGITADRDRAHPAKVVTVFLNDPAFLEDELELDKIITHIFNSYNKKGIHQEIDSPNEIFRDNPRPNCLALEEVDKAFLFGTLVNRKILRSQVTIEKRDHQFFDESIVPFIEEEVDCYTYIDSPDSIFVFVKNSYEYIGEFKYYEALPKAKINQTDDDRQRLSKMVVMQNTQVENIMKEKQIGLEQIMAKTGNVNPGLVAMYLIDQNLPEKPTSVSHLNPAATPKIDINLFNLGNRKEAKKAGTSKRKPQPVSTEGLLTDNTKNKYA